MKYSKKWNNVICGLWFSQSTTLNLTFYDSEFSDIKKIILIYIFALIIVCFYFKFYYKVI